LRRVLVTSGYSTGQQDSMACSMPVERAFSGIHQRRKYGLFNCE
jgi:hypothetical protein